MRFIRLIVASAPLFLSCATPLHAQETTLTVGAAGNITATNSLEGRTTSESISTAQIDGVLRVVAPGTFGQNFTRDKANKVFADFANLRAGLSTALAQTIATLPNIRRVNSATVNTSALDLRLSQKTNSVTGQLGTITAAVSLVADVDGLQSLICPSANVTFTVDKIKASGDYNYISGDISNAAVVYEVTNVSASCNGLLGFVGDAFGNPSATARSQINAAIQSEINTQTAFINMKSLFSLSDFANGLRYYGNETIISPLVNRAINVFRELVNDAAINTPGIVLNVGVKFADVAGTQNVVSFIASHAPVDVTIVRRVGTVDLVVPPGTAQSDVYYSNIVDAQGNRQNWRFLGSTTGSVLNYGGNLPNVIFDGALVIAIGRNSTIPGLESLPGIPRTFYYGPSGTRR